MGAFAVGIVGISLGGLFSSSSKAGNGSASADYLTLGYKPHCSSYQVTRLLNPL